MIDITLLTSADRGRWVEYQRSLFPVERGRISLWNKHMIFVVFRCDDDWEHFERYTSQACEPIYLTFAGGEPQRKREFFWVRGYRKRLWHLAETMPARLGDVAKTACHETVFDPRIRIGLKREGLNRCAICDAAARRIEQGVPA